MSAQNVIYPPLKTTLQLQQDLDQADSIITQLLIQFCERNELNKPLDKSYQLNPAILDAMNFMEIN